MPRGFWQVASERLSFCLRRPGDVFQTSWPASGSWAGPSTTLSSRWPHLSTALSSQPETGVHATHMSASAYRSLSLGTHTPRGAGGRGRPLPSATSTWRSTPNCTRASGASPEAPSLSFLSARKLQLCHFRGGQGGVGASLIRARPAGPLGSAGRPVGRRTRPLSPNEQNWVLVASDGHGDRNRWTRTRAALVTTGGGHPVPVKSLL